MSDTARKDALSPLLALKKFRKKGNKDGVMCTQSLIGENTLDAGFKVHGSIAKSAKKKLRT